MIKLSKLKFLEKFTEKGKSNFIVLLGLVGVFLIMISDLNFLKTTDKTKDKNTLSEYKLQIEKEITQLLKEIDGVGNVKVMISLESSGEAIYVQEEKNVTDKQINENEKSIQESEKSTYENQIVIVGSNSDKSALVEKTLQPTIQGVAVVCSGADDISVISAVTNSVAVVLNVPTHKICVTKMR